MPGGSSHRPPAKLLKWIGLLVFVLSLFFLLLYALNRKENQKPALPTTPILDSVPQPNPPEPATDTVSLPKVAAVDSALVDVNVKSKAWLKHRPDTVVLVGHLWSFIPKVTTWPQVQIEVKLGPPGMGVEDGSLRYLPQVPGRLLVRLNLWPVGNIPANQKPEPIRLSFYINAVNPASDTAKEPTQDTAQVPVAASIPVTAMLQAPKDTLEPGSKGDFIIGALTGVPPFNLSLDIDKDGKEDWKGNQPGRVTLDFTKSGKFVAQLRIVDAKGLTNQVEASYVVNEKIRIHLECKAPKVNLITPASFRAELQDGDDSLLSIQGFLPNHSGGTDTVLPERMEKSQYSQKVKAYWNRKWTKPGRYQVHACGVATDERSACDTVQVEVFNAKPGCKILDALKPVPGIPVTITGRAHDEDGSIVLWEWNLDGDKHFEMQRKDDAPVHFTFARKGKFPLVFKATSADGVSCQDSLLIQVKSSW